MVPSDHGVHKECLHCSVGAQQHHHQQHPLHATKKVKHHLCRAASATSGTTEERPEPTDAARQQAPGDLACATCNLLHDVGDKEYNRWLQRPSWRLGTWQKPCQVLRRTRHRAGAEQTSHEVDLSPGYESVGDWAPQIFAPDGAYGQRITTQKNCHSRGETTTRPATPSTTLSTHHHARTAPTMADKQAIAKHKVFVGGLSWETSVSPLLPSAWKIRDDGVRRSVPSGSVAAGGRWASGRPSLTRPPLPLCAHLLAHKTTQGEKLRAYFENFGAVREAFVSYNRNNGRPRGFGFVVFESPEVADKVVATKHMIDRREVRVLSLTGAVTSPVNNGPTRRPHLAAAIRARGVSASGWPRAGTAQ